MQFTNLTETSVWYYKRGGYENTCADINHATRFNKADTIISTGLASISEQELVFLISRLRLVRV